MCLALRAIPTAKGTYILVLRLVETCRLRVGRLGEFELRPGHYLYVGSAHGPGGPAARIGHHLDRSTPPHWHLDVLMPFVQPLAAWVAVSDRKLERDWAALLRRQPGLRPAIPGFGASDHRRAKTTHLFYGRKRPAFAAFQRQVRQHFGPDVGTLQCVSLSSAAGARENPGSPT